MLSKLAAVKRALAEIGPTTVEAAHRLQASGVVNRLSRT